jgi:hypothetical protein
MYPRNAASPEPISIGAVIQVSDGAVQTSGVTVRIKPIGVAEDDGGGTTAYSTDGIVLYTPTQAETNYTSFILIAKKTGCIPVSITVVTTASSVPGRTMPADGSVTADVIANGAIDAATFAADVDAEILSYLVDDATRIDATALNTATVTTIPAIIVHLTDIKGSGWDGEDLVYLTTLTGDVFNSVYPLQMVPLQLLGTSSTDGTYIHLDGLGYGDDQINNHLVMIRDTSDGHKRHYRWITDWVASTKVATLHEALPFTPAAADFAIVLSLRRDVRDFENSQRLSLIQGSGFDTNDHSLERIRTLGDINWVTATGFSTPTNVTDARDAIIVQTDIIKAKTNQFVFTVANKVDSTPTVTAAEANKIADHTLRRTQANVELSVNGDTLNIGSLYGFIQTAQESNTTDNVGRITVYRTDGTTELGQRTIATDANADPITGVS